MADDLQLSSVRAFDLSRVPHTLDDVLKRDMNTNFVDKLPWLDVFTKNMTEDGQHGDLKYSITSIRLFAEWLVRFDDYAVKDDYGYHWNGDYWERLPVKSVYNMIDVAIMAITDTLRISANKKRELQKDVKTYLIEISRGFDDSIKSKYIAFKGMTLNVTTNVFFTEGRKEKYVIGGFDFKPQANVVPDTWVAYAQYMFGDNAPFLWAWLGYAFQADMNWRQGALFLLDPIGGTGKTYFITKITQAMFGNNRIGAFKLKNLQGNNARFETARFVGKSLMIDDDATRVRFKEDDVFKAVTGGGLTPVERKGIDGSEYRITAKMIINVNEMPTFNNAGAITRRLHIIKTVAPKATADEIAIRNELFPEWKLEEEIPMLAAYAIEMYQRAVKEDWHVLDNIADDIVAVDPFVDWVTKLEKGMYKSGELYERYVKHWETFEFSGPDAAPMTKQKFGRQMTQWARKVNARDARYYEIR